MKLIIVELDGSEIETVSGGAGEETGLWDGWKRWWTDLNGGSIGDDGFGG